MDASNEAIGAAARRLGVEPDALRAVIEVEASGRWLDQHGEPIRRFEPHKFRFRDRFGWAGGWRDYLRVGRASRARMFDQAAAISAEEAHRAASWGGPQIMGFNHAAAGYPTAVCMAEGFRDVDAQVGAFASLVDAWGLAPALASRDWRSFARAYNGPGQVDVYAGRMEAAYRRITGRGSPVVIRVGDRGEAVRKAQAGLARLGHLPKSAIDGIFGPGTRAAVVEFQGEQGLAVDGVVGRATWDALSRKTGATAPAQPSDTGRKAALVERIAPWAGLASAGTIGAVREEAGALAADLGLTLPQLVLFVVACVSLAYLATHAVSYLDRRPSVWRR